MDSQGKHSIWVLDILGCRVLALGIFIALVCSHPEQAIVLSVHGSGNSVLYQASMISVGSAFALCCFDLYKRTHVVITCIACSSMIIFKFI